MFKSLFKRKRKPADSNLVPEGIEDAIVGDVFTIQGYEVEYDGGFYVIEAKRRYATVYNEWSELIGADGDKRLWVYWSKDGGELFISVAASHESMSLDDLGLTPQDLQEVDAQQSRSNHFTHEGKDYYYHNSGEAQRLQDGQEDGEGYYVWELISSDEETALSIEKYEGRPFECYFTTVIKPHSVTVYKQ